MCMEENRYSKMGICWIVSVQVNRCVFLFALTTKPLSKSKHLDAQYSYLSLRVNEPGSVGLSGGVPLPWLYFLGALLNGCNLRWVRGDGWSIFTALITWFGMSRVAVFNVSLCGWFHSVCKMRDWEVGTITNYPNNNSLKKKCKVTLTFWLVAVTVNHCWC